MSNQPYQPPVEVEGSFADLGLEDPTIPLPTNFPIGTFKGFIKFAGFVQNKSDNTKRNLMLTYQIREPGNPASGKTKDEYKPANKFDEAKAKGYLISRLNDLGVARNDVGTLNVKTLQGLPVYFTVAEDLDRTTKKPTGNTRITRVTLDTDGEHVNIPSSNGAAATNTPPPAVDAASLGY
jgi:hypothetical protein